MKRLVAIAAALAVGFIAGAIGLASYHADIERDPVLGYPTVQEVSDFDLLERSYACRVAQGDNPKLVFGSSELNPAHAGAAHPASMLEGGRYGIDVMVMGRAFCEDLWQAIEVGAFANRLDDKRVVIVPSMQWFMCYRTPAKNFKASFSEGAYRAFMENDDISDEAKRAVTDRMASYGVDRSSAPNAVEGLRRALDEWSGGLASSLRLGIGWRDEGAEPVGEPASEGVADNGAVRFQRGDGGGQVAPDWDDVFAQADASARARVTNNDMGIADAWYAEQCDKWIKGASRWHVKDGAYFSGEELENFKLLLRVCRESGVEPLVLIQPVKGELYDKTIYDRGVREQYYQMIRSACAQNGVEVADFSGHEYDTYFLREYSHPSDLGSAYYSKAIYRYFTEGVVDTSPSGGVKSVGAGEDR